MLLPHEFLPPPFDRWLSLLLLASVPNANFVLCTAIALLSALALYQQHQQRSAPTIPLKRLPKRPVLSILFKPDELPASSELAPDSTASVSIPQQTSSSGEGSYPSGGLLNSTRSQEEDERAQDGNIELIPEKDTDKIGVPVTVPEDDQDDDSLLHDDLDDDASDLSSIPPPVVGTTDIPDSFAPLLSSGSMEVLTNQLTTDLIHAIQTKASLRLRPGRHEIPLDQNAARPQFILDVPPGGCRISAMAAVGSHDDNITTLASDAAATTPDFMDASSSSALLRPEAHRTKPIVKHASLVLDPPLPLVNVAPTLIHFPTLFQDNFLPILRGQPIIRWLLDLLSDFSSYVEKCLWLLESKGQIHLTRINLTPIVVGKQWRLRLSFTGHVLVFGVLPVPFVSVRLPTVIIPQPHALLEYLISKEPLASAKLHRENISEEQIALALLHTVETWNARVQLVATPPAVGVDVTLPGGVAVGLEMALGREAGQRLNTTDIPASSDMGGSASNAKKKRTAVAGGGESLYSASTWTSHVESSRRPRSASFDANNLVPWSFELAAKGTVSKEKLTLHILKTEAKHTDEEGPVTSHVGARGSFAVWKVPPPNALQQHHPALLETSSPSVASILLFNQEKYIHDDWLQYDYVFDVHDHSQVDAITVSVGATHPMLKGGTMVTTILDNIYAYGSVSAREKAILDPKEMHRKRNILRHLPATDFHFGIQNVYIPPESDSYSDDGLTLFLPQLERGRMRVHIVGGVDTPGGDDHSSVGSGPDVAEGIQMTADFEVPSMHVQSEGIVKEFPELDILEGVKLRTLLHGVVGGTVRAHLRPQHLSETLTTTGPNVLNPLEAYEIDFSSSSLSVKMKEYTVSLGHRRLIFPAESTFLVKVVESVVDMGFEGKTQCELSWDFQGLSPILQVTSLGETPEDAVPENKEQASILIPPLRQGRLSFRVSSVGGISINKAATMREDKEGLYDWKFFNALVSPDDESAGRILDVLHDKRTMEKLLQIIKLINADLHRILRYLLRQVWRGKEILDQEGVKDPKHAIPMYKMARLVCLFLTGDYDKVDIILPIVRRVIKGEGLDVVTVKELLREHVESYEEWSVEIDRGVRWAALALGPMAVSQANAEEEVPPLVALPYYAQKFDGIPSACELYQMLRDKPHLPLDVGISSLVSRVAPYLTFQQVDFILQARASTDWQPSDLRRIRYVYSIKKKVLEIAESYGGMSFLPQSFLVSVFLGEATRSSYRAVTTTRRDRRERRRRGRNPISLRPNRSPADSKSQNDARKGRSKSSILSRLRKRRVGVRQDIPLEDIPQAMEDTEVFSPAERVASSSNLLLDGMESDVPKTLFINSKKSRNSSSSKRDSYSLGDSLLGPQDVAILLQAGLTSVMKSSTVVQLNQRMLLDLICSQPKSFAVAVLAEIGTPSGQGSPRSLTSALMALLELDQTSFKPNHKIDMHVLLESWLPGLKVPRRGDYMAGGRWARQSYYEALFSVANSILDDAELYMAVKGHLQRVRHRSESDPLPRPRSVPDQIPDSNTSTKLLNAVSRATECIDQADKAGASLIESLIGNETATKQSESYKEVVSLYQQSFQACAKVLSLDKHAFYADWFRNYYKRNYDALMIKSMLDNVVQGVDSTRYWLNALRKGARRIEANRSAVSGTAEQQDNSMDDDLFLEADKVNEQTLLDAILDAIIYDKGAREKLRKDPLVRFLIANPPGKYDFAIVSAMGVITEGKKGLELQDAFERLREQRGVVLIRADTGTARSLEFNANKIEEAINTVVSLKKPFGLLGYSQGCANALLAESMLLSGSPSQQQALSKANGGLVCRQLLFSAANGSFHGPAMEKKIQRLIVVSEEFFKYQQGYFSRALSSSVLETLNTVLDSAAFHKTMGGAQSFLPDGCRAFWRELQHLSDVPTCTLKGVMEEHTTPECLEMISHLLTKQSGSPLHDSQVHVFDAVAYPVYYHNRNGRLLRKCAIGEGAIQRTHHWSPLSDEVEFVRTVKDLEMASFDCAKDRHVFPWVDVNARFGFIKYQSEESDPGSAAGATPARSVLRDEVHPNKLLLKRNKSAEPKAEDDSSSAPERPLSI